MGRSATPYHVCASGNNVDARASSPTAVRSPEIKVEDDDGFEQWLAQGAELSSGVPMASIETD